MAPTGSGPGLIGVLIRITFSLSTNFHWWVTRFIWMATSKIWNSFCPLSSIFFIVPLERRDLVYQYMGGNC
jgi:hypothetical protein